MGFSSWKTCGAQEEFAVGVPVSGGTAPLEAVSWTCFSTAVSWLEMDACSSTSPSAAPPREDVDDLIFRTEPTGPDWLVSQR